MTTYSAILPNTDTSTVEAYIANNYVFKRFNYLGFLPDTGINGPEVYIANNYSVRSVPDAPSNLIAIPGDEEVILTWDAPYAGGSIITDYVVEYKDNEDIEWIVFTDGVSATTGATVTGLTNGILYDFRVKAENNVGFSAYSSTVSSMPGRVSSPPQNLQGTPTADSINITWEFPLDDGEVPGQGYLVYLDSVFVEFISLELATEYTFTGLTPNTSYLIEVTFANDIGESDPATLILSTLNDIPVAYTGATKTGRLNQLAGTTDETAYSAANIYAGVSGESLTTALNIVAGTEGETATSAANIIAGTTGETLTSALNKIGLEN
jgi:hypothetical protein